MRLLRPLHPMVSYAVENLAAIPLRMVVALPVAVLALVLTGASRLPRDPLLWVVFLLSLLGGWLITFLANAGIGTLALWTGSSVKVMDVWLAALHGVQRVPHSGGALPAGHPGHHRGAAVPLPDRLPGGAAHPGAGPRRGAAAAARAVDLGGAVRCSGCARSGGGGCSGSRPTADDRRRALLAALPGAGPELGPAGAAVPGGLRARRRGLAVLDPHRAGPAVHRLPPPAERGRLDLRGGAAGHRLVHPAARPSSRAPSTRASPRWWSTSARARSTSCSSSPPTPSSWSPPRASSRGGAPTW